MITEMSIDNINANAPYFVFNISQGGFTFATDYGIDLIVEFQREDNMLELVETYQFGLRNKDHRPSPRDPKVQDTISAILAEFFRVNRSALLYLCDSAGGQQAARARLFRQWFDTTLLDVEIHREDAEIHEEDGEINYISMLIRKDSPYCEIAIKEFREQVELFNKP